VLSQATRVLDRRGRGLYRRQVYPVLHDLQARLDVAVDARSQQGQQRLVLLELGNLPHYRPEDIGRHRLPGHRRGDVRRQLGDPGTFRVHVHQWILA